MSFYSILYLPNFATNLCTVSIRLTKKMFYLLSSDTLLQQLQFVYFKALFLWMLSSLFKIILDNCLEKGGGGGVNGCQKQALSGNYQFLFSEKCTQINLITTLLNFLFFIQAICIFGILIRYSIFKFCIVLQTTFRRY